VEFLKYFNTSQEKAMRHKKHHCLPG